MYISSDGGATNNYNANSNANVYAYRTLEIAEEGGYIISFDSYVVGESSYDYVRAFLAPGDQTFEAGSSAGISQDGLPEGCIALDGGNRISGQSGWETKRTTESLSAGTYKLVFYWRNDGSGGDAPVAIDNVSVEQLLNEPNIIADDNLDFSLTGIGGSSTAKLTVNNIGGGALNISDITFDNPCFSLASNISFPVSVPALSGSHTFVIRFSPTATGETSGQMTIHSNGPDVTVALSGSGYEPITLTDDAPLFEDFNNIDSSLPNLGLEYWQLNPGYATGNSATKWTVNTSTSYAYDGKSLKATDASATTTALLISPRLKLDADRNAKILFYMSRAGGTSKPNEGFKVYVCSESDIYTYDENGQIIINEDQSVPTVVEPVLHAKRCGGPEITKAGMYQLEVNVPAEFSGKDFHVIFEAIQEYGSDNYIDNIKVELLPNTPRLESSTQLIDFGLVKAGEAASREFTLSNIGTNVLSVSFSQAQENSSFTITPENGEINFNEQQTFTVNFSADEVGQYNDSIFISTNSNSDTIALVAETYPATSYYETFDASTELPAEWVIVQNGGGTNYSVKDGTGADGSNALTGAVDYWGDSESLDSIFSPVVSGKVSFDFKKAYSSSSTFEAYLVDAEGNKSTIDLGANSTNWTNITIDEVPEGSRIAFLINNSYLDNFMAFGRQEITKGVQVVKNSLNRPSSFFSLYAGESRATDNTIQFTFKNIGTQAIEAGSYNFTTQLVDEQQVAVEGVTYKTYIQSGEETILYEDNVIPGPALGVNEEKTISGYLLIECANEINKLAFNVKVNQVENTHFTLIQTGNNLTIKPNKGSASLSALDFGLNNSPATADYTIRNSSNNGALTISAITAPEGSAFSVAAELPITIPDNQSATIQITFAGDPGIYNDSLTVEHDGVGDQKIAVSGTMLSPTALLESFEGESFPPILWESKQGKWKTTTDSKHHGNASVVNTENVADTLVTPLLHLAAGDSIAFAAKATASTGYNTDLLYSADGKTWQTLESISVYNSYWNTWEPMAVYMPEDFVEGDYYIGFASKKTYLDLIYGPQVVYQEHRIDIKSFSGKNKGMVNYTQDFTIDIACLGTEGETADSYSIDLMNGNETIGSYTVEPMVLGDMKSYTCSWTPHTTGEAQVYALLTLNGVVTSTDTITVNVIEESLITNIMIGDLSTKVATPNYKHFLYETLYTPADLTGLNAGDVIETVNVPYFVTDAAVKGYRVNIWIGNTEKSSLTTDKMSEADITGLSHIGADLRFEVGGSQEEPLYFEMRPETPITYEGGNLSLIVAVDSTYYKTGINFFSKAVATKSMKYFNCDGDTSADYMDTWTNGTYTTSLRENIMVVQLGLATEAPTVYGVVTRSDNDEPIEGATVTMKSGEIIYSTTTDASGAYSIDVLQPGKEYEMSVSKDSYTGVEGVIVAVDKDDVEQNFELTVISGIDHTAEAATKIFTDRAGNIHIKAGAPIDLVKVYSISGSLCITESPATDSAVINAANLKGVYIVEVQTAGNVKRAKVRL